MGRENFVDAFVDKDTNRERAKFVEVHDSKSGEKWVGVRIERRKRDNTNCFLLQYQESMKVGRKGVSPNLNAVRQVWVNEGIVDHEYGFFVKGVPDLV